jgi:hypothetical protein
MWINVPVGVDKSKSNSHTSRVKDEPWSPPIVQVGEETVAYLLCWERHEGDGSWHAWVTWIRIQAGRPSRHVVSVRAASVRPLEQPGAYRQVPRWVRGNDGVIRLWAAPLHERPLDVVAADLRGPVVLKRVTRSLGDPSCAVQ